ncbi:MAG TPA: hypothetical protein DIC34_03920 [Treponema sp.]|nr:MAG: hypothetical protein A2001_04840 [Treponema sp. GWC1_61_84]OHE74185.1 MAG: hypothetical protein A2413_16395 [Treponema sp. RIFOXYC1_FULL_61_9]HCM25684.1 hypothetical protein [Treponema sp.]
MEQLVNEIRLGYADRIINERLSSLKSSSSIAYTKHFTQGEEYFVQLDKPFTVPRFPIHHDVRQTVPRADYMNSLRDWIDGLVQVVPDFFSDLIYFFDPSEISKPCFYRLYRIGEEYFLYLLRIDLACRALEFELLERGSNDETAAYRTNRLYLESEFIPLASVISELGKVMAFAVRQTISQTWIGETGKGYMVRGIWMDSELSKFFTKLLIPAGKRIYPYYPYTCKYKTICMTVLDPKADSRRKLLPYLHKAVEILLPEIDHIQNSLKNTSFSETMPLFRDLKAKIPDSLIKPWENLELKAYLNEREQKEYIVEL